MSADRNQLLVRSESDEGQLLVAKAVGNITRDTLMDVPNPEDVLHTEAFAKKLLFDLSDSRLIDSTGVSWLLELHRRCDRENGQLVIHSVQPTVLRVFKTLNLHTFFHIAEDEAAARKL